MPRRVPGEDAIRDQMREEADHLDKSPGAGEAPGQPAAADEGPAPPAPEGDGGAIPEEVPVGEDEATLGEAGEGEQDPLAQAEADRDRYLELARRTQADFENYRKRAAKEAASAGERAKTGLLRELLPVLDNLERALEAVSDEEHGALAEGLRLVHTELLGVLSRNGVEPIDAEGQPFDPTVHEALSTQAQDGVSAGQVLHVAEKGYKLNEAVLRPARVVVSA